MSSGREDLIRIRAYEIWEEEGRPEGREREHWIRAAAELEESVVLDDMTDKPDEAAPKAKKPRATATRTKAAPKKAAVGAKAAAPKAKAPAKPKGAATKAKAPAKPRTRKT